ncbi:MAG: hypothetical protein ACKVP0_01860 [Pirellulaceae bacterium]
MAATRKSIEQRIDLNMGRKGLSRKEAIKDLLKGARRGAGKAESEGMHAQDALVEAQKRLKEFQRVRGSESVLASDVTAEEENIAKLEREIQRQGRFAANEQYLIAMLNSILDEQE